MDWASYWHRVNVCGCVGVLYRAPGHLYRAWQVVADTKLSKKKADTPKKKQFHTLFWFKNTETYGLGVGVAPGKCVRVCGGALPRIISTF